MTDDEIIKYATKASGSTNVLFDPVNNDSDAFWLQVKMCFDVRVYKFLDYTTVTGTVAFSDKVFQRKVHHKENAIGATRRAISEVAAWIGKEIV